MTTDSLLLLPFDILVSIFSFLSTNDVNAVRETSRDLLKLVTANEKILYAKRFVHVTVEFPKDNQADVTYKTNKFYFKLNFSNEKCTEATMALFNTEIAMDLVWKGSVEDAVRGLSLAECTKIVTQRSGGIRPLEIRDTLDSDGLNFHQSLLLEAKELALSCYLKGISHDIAYQQLCASKRSLTVYDESLVDDRFCREAGAERIHIGCYDLQLTADQMMTLINRQDIKQLGIFKEQEMSVESIRDIVQGLLNNGIAADLKFVGTIEDNQMRLLTHKIGEESITLTEYTNRFAMPIRQLSFVIGTRQVQITTTDNPIRLVSTNNYEPSEEEGPLGWTFVRKTEFLLGSFM